MPPTIYVDRHQSEQERRESLYAGDFQLLTRRPASLELVSWIRSLLGETFAGLDPQRAQRSLSVDEFVRRVGPLKSKFTNAEETKRLCRELIVSLGCDPEQTYFDLPRLRAVPADDYLTTGVSYAYKAHRDTWYAHPPMLINFWIPVFDACGEEVMAFWPGYWGQQVPNSGFDYGEWVQKHRFSAAGQVGREDRPHPLPSEQIDPSREIRIALNAGDITMFSTCQLHATARNTSGRTRYSFDLRTLHLPDLLAGRGPRDVDGQARGSTVGDFLRVSDFAPLDLSALRTRISA